MKEVVKKVRLLQNVDADMIAVNKDHYFPEAYVVDLPLESVPDHIWQDIFERLWKSSRHLWDRKLFVIGSKLRLVTTIDDIEDKIDWIRHVIERTNEEIEKYNLEVKELETQAKEGEHARAFEKERTNVDLVREILRKRMSSG